MCLREISPLGPSREARSLSASYWGPPPSPRLFPTSGLVPSHADKHVRRWQRLVQKVAWTLTSHWKGFSPVWVLMCSSSPLFWLKALLHSLHLYGFSCNDTHTHTHTHTHAHTVIKERAEQYIKQYFPSLDTYGQNLERDSCPLQCTRV